MIRTLYKNYERHNMAFDLDFNHKFTKGELLINTHFTDYDNKQNQDVISDYFEEDGTFIETTAFNSLNDQHTKNICSQSRLSICQ